MRNYHSLDIIYLLKDKEAIESVLPDRKKNYGRSFGGNTVSSGYEFDPL